MIYFRFIMHSRFSKPILLFSFLFFGTTLYAQDLKLTIVLNELKKELKIKQINYDSIFKNYSEVKKEALNYSEKLKKIGFFTNTIDSLIKNDTNYTAYINLGNRVTVVQFVNNTQLQKNIIDSLNGIKKQVPIELLESYLLELNNNLEQAGRSFSKIKVNPKQIKKDTLFASLSIEESKQRKIDKIVIQGYSKFPKNYIKNYFDFSTSTIYSSKTLLELETKLNSLNFVKATKKPEALFKPDSTVLYLGLKKESNNSIDGLINFASRENGEFLITGNVDLQLKNLLDYGEEITFFWNSAGNNRQELKIKTFLPYLFSSKISPEINFEIYRQDSSFTNTRFSSKVNYSLSNKFSLGASFNLEASTSIQNELDLNSYSNLFAGIDFKYTSKNFNLNFNPEIGYRNTSIRTDQFRTTLDVNYIFNTSKRLRIFTNSRTGILSSNNYLANELFRVGGANSIRGFNEQEFFTENFTFINFELQYFTAQNSYFYTITDYGLLFNQSFNSNLLGLGLGYLFRKDNTELNINLAVGKQDNIPFNTQNTKLIVSWRNYF